jgi:lipid-binding SYLF domain-containing protein
MEAAVHDSGKMSKVQGRMVALSLALASTFVPITQSASAATAVQLNAEGAAALQRLYAESTKAARYGRTAHAILVFPKIVKAGFIIGGQGGEGVLFIGGRPAGYYRISAVSYGLQAGGQSFSYALFIMNEKSLSYLNKSDGWAIGSGPSVVVMDKGKAMSTTSTTLSQDVYAFPFGQKGLMAGMGLEGSKITRITK